MPNFFCLAGPLAPATLALGLLAASLAARAQAPAASTPVPQIQLVGDEEGRSNYGAQRNFYFLPPGKTGESNEVNAGFFGQRLRPYVESNPEALRELNNYRRQKTLFLVDKAVLLGAVVVYGTQVFREKEAQYFNPVQRVAVGAAVVSLIGTLFINRRTNEYFRQAVDNYNTGPAPQRRGWLRPPSGVGVGSLGNRPTLVVAYRF